MLCPMGIAEVNVSEQLQSLSFRDMLWPGESQDQDKFTSNPRKYWPSVGVTLGTLSVQNTDRAQLLFWRRPNWTQPLVHGFVLWVPPTPSPVTFLLGQLQL